jgi:chromosome segregation ATPase
MNFKELHQRRNTLESLLRSAQELPEQDPNRKLAESSILHAIMLEKRGEHDQCDSALMALRLRLAIGIGE